MQRFIALTISAFVWSIALGCGQSADQQEAAAKNQEKPAMPVESSAEDQKAETGLDAQKVRKTIEAGCAKCMFKMKGIDTHELAVKIDGKPYLVTGEYIETPETGLCEKVKKAQVVGQILQYGEGATVNDQEGEFIAESIELQE